MGNKTNLLECTNEESGFSGPGSWYGRDFGVSCGEFSNRNTFNMMNDL